MDLYSIRTLSRRSGVTVKTIRYYSNQGLLPPAAISAAGYRLYSDRELERLYQIMGLRWLGASIQQIRAILGGQLSLKELLNLQETAIQEEITRLERMQSRVQATQLMLERGDDVVGSLRELGEIMQATRNQRRSWFQEWLQHYHKDVKQWEDAIQSLLEVGKTVYEEEPQGLRLFLLQAFRNKKTLPDVLPGTPSSWGLNEDASSWSEWWTRQQVAIEEMRKCKDCDPKSAPMQKALRDWISTFGPVTVEGVQRIYDTLNAPEAQHLVETLMQRTGSKHLGQWHQHLRLALEEFHANLKNSSQTQGDR